MHRPGTRSEWMFAVLAFTGLVVGLPWMLIEGFGAEDGLGVYVGVVGMTSLFMLLGSVEGWRGTWNRRLARVAFTCALPAAAAAFAGELAGEHLVLLAVQVIGMWITLLALFANALAVAVFRRRAA